MRGKASRAVLDRIVAFDEDRFVSPHFRHVEPAVSGVVPDAVSLASPDFVPSDLVYRDHNA
jgi:hypothetical protein